MTKKANDALIDVAKKHNFSVIRDKEELAEFTLLAGKADEMLFNIKNNNGSLDIILWQKFQLACDPAIIYELLNFYLVFQPLVNKID